MDDRPRYMISVAAELVGMHPQTLRMYEQKGLVQPQRTAGNTRLYSEADLDRLRLIQKLTTQLGLNLAGVELVLRMEDELRRMQSRMEQIERQMRQEIENVHKQYRRDLVPWQAEIGYGRAAVSGRLEPPIAAGLSATAVIVVYPATAASEP